jgi:hypothetical protein
MRPDEAAAREFGTMEAVRGHLLLTNCLEDELTRPNIELALKADRLLWLDLEGTDDEVLTLLHEVFKIHPLAVEDVKEFHQRPKIEDYDDFVSIVVYGARGLGEPLTEVHCFYAERFLVSVHRDEVPAVADACHTLGRLHTDRRLVALYRLLDALVDTMFPYLSAMDELPRLAVRLARRVHVDGVQPAQRRDETAHHHRHRVPAAVVPDRVLRAEPGLAGEPGRVADGVPHLRHRHRGAGRHRPVRHVPAARLDGQEELTRRTGSAPGRAREEAPG